MDKADIIERLTAELQRRYTRAQAALEAAHEAATGDDSKAEGKYDTRGLEASYLAAGQAEQAEQLARDLERFTSLSLPDFEPDDSIDAGALVETEHEGELAYYLLAPSGGGLDCEVEASDGSPSNVTVLAPESPLREKLVGRRAGDLMEDPELMILELW